VEGSSAIPGLRVPVRFFVGSVTTAISRATYKQGTGTSHPSSTMMSWLCIQEWDCSDEFKNGGAVINLRGKCIGDVEAERIADALMDPNTVVQKLILSNNAIGDKGATAIGKALQKNSKLQELYLDVNQYITADGAKAITEALTKNSTLQGLFLQGNKIGDDGAKAIAEALTENSILQKLNLSDNIIGDDGAVAIANAVTNNSTLQNLFLCKNDISPGVITSINISLSKEYQEKRQRDAGHKDQECCSMCGHHTTLGLSCSDHFICARHLRSNKGIGCGEVPLKCMMEDCSKCYRQDDVQKWLPPSKYRDYVFLEGMNTKYTKMFEEMIKNTGQSIESKIDVALEDIRYLGTPKKSRPSSYCLGVPRH
jgi:Leucine Rich repeat